MTLPRAPPHSHWQIVGLRTSTNGSLEYSFAGMFKAFSKWQTTVSQIAWPKRVKDTTDPGGAEAGLPYYCGGCFIFFFAYLRHFSPSSLKACVTVEKLSAVGHAAGSVIHGGGGDSRG